MNTKKHHLILFLLLIFLVKTQAQVFIPFSYWKGLAPLTLSPASPLYMVVNDTRVITATGGMGVYTWSNAAGDGSSITSTSDPIDFLANTADYVARATANATDTITVTSGTATATLSVITYNSLAVSPTVITKAINSTQAFTATGGCLNGVNCAGGAYVFSVVSGGGSITSPGGVFTAPAIAGTTVIQVADSIGNTATATITVVNTLTINPASLKISVFSTNAFSAILGTPAYTYSVIAGTGGTGTVVAGTGVYTAPSTTGTNTVRVTDSLAATADSAETIIKPVDIQVGQYFACALHNEGSVKCWGTGLYGQVGNASTAVIGDDAAEIGGANVFINLGTGRTATSIAVGLDHACALLDNATVKCWGRNDRGQLGKGNTTTLGDTANEMGDNLTAINLGTGRTATAVYAFGYVSCAKLDNATVKCWGDNTYGQMGIGNTNHRGDAVNEMGDNLLPLSLGTGRTATKLVGGFSYICALLDNATVKCWGRNDRGQLGKDNSTTLGDTANEMGDNLTAVNINGNSGGARTATDLVGGYEYNCVSRDNASMICWGRNSNGQLGKGSTAGNDANIGDQAGEMAAIAAINMNAGFATLTNIYATGRTTCAKDNANMFKCWGRNTEGQLLLGNTTNATAPPAAALNIGAGLVVAKLFANYYTLCALFSTNDRIKCWGQGTNAAGAAHGVFISTSATHLGDAAGETGAGLPYINH